MSNSIAATAVMNMLDAQVFRCAHRRRLLLIRPSSDAGQGIHGAEVFGGVSPRHLERLLSVDELADAEDLRAVLREPDRHDALVPPLLPVALQGAEHQRLHDQGVVVGVVEDGLRHHAERLEDAEDSLRVLREGLLVTRRYAQALWEHLVREVGVEWF